MISNPIYGKIELMATKPPTSHNVCFNGVWGWCFSVAQLLRQQPRVQKMVFHLALLDGSQHSIGRWVPQGPIYGGVLKWRTGIAGWFMMENPSVLWMSMDGWLALSLWKPPKVSKFVTYLVHCSSKHNDTALATRTMDVSAVYALSSVVFRQIPRENYNSSDECGSEVQSSVNQR